MPPERTILVVSESFGTGEHIAELLDELEAAIKVVTSVNGLETLPESPSVAIVEDSFELGPAEVRERLEGAVRIVYLQGEDSLARIERNAARSDGLLAKPFTRRGVVAAVLSALHSDPARLETAPVPGNQTETEETDEALAEFAEELSRPLTIQVLLVEHLLELCRESEQVEIDDLEPLLEQLRRTTRELSELVEAKSGSDSPETGGNDSPLSFPDDQRGGKELLG